MLSLILLYQNFLFGLFFQKKDQKQLYELKREISLMSKKNFTLERDIRNLDKKIALLIRNRISVEVCAPPPR